jgi:Zn-dependent metalloprotease
VHINSTVPSHASYLIFQALGKEQAETLIFTTLTQKITAKSTFASNAQATVDACSLMYDSDSCTKVVSAFRQVGLNPKIKALRRN